MAALKVTLETVTPLFLAGADPRRQPELRAASVRGALRFWLRALLGGVLGDSDLDVLRQAESAVFGSTQTGASAVVVRLDGTLDADRFPLLPHRAERQAPTPAIKPNCDINLLLAPRPPHRAFPEAACGALLLLILLGGLGKRSRRGFGSFIVRPTRGGFPLQLPDYSDADGFSKQLPSLIQQAANTAESFIQVLGLHVGTLSAHPQFTILHNQHTKVLFCKKSFTEWEEAMKAFWSVLRSDPYRDNYVFGLPSNVGRQASPLHLRIVKFGKGYHMLLAAFHVHFVGQQPSWGMMQKFLDECKQKWEGEWAFGGDVPWQ